MLAAMRRLLALTGFIALVAATALPAAAAAQPWPMAVRAQMLRLAEVDWRLRNVAAPLCPATASGLGLWVDHAAAYPAAERALLARVLRLGALPQVSAVASGSPAARAGIRPGDEIVAIQGLPVSAMLAKAADPALVADDMMDRLAAMPPGRTVRLVLRRGRTSLSKQVVPVPVCAARIVLQPSPELAAYNDGKAIAVTSGLIDLTANDDELALVVGHELAHIVDPGEVGTVTGDDPASEQAADLLGAALAHCAGYDVARAAGLWPRYRERVPPARLHNPSHPAPEQRERAIRAAAPGLTCPVSLASGPSLRQ
jgi:Zn-dependent protease with chaperone function